MSKQLLLQSLQSQRQTSLLCLVHACYGSTFFPTHSDNFIPCNRTGIDCSQLYPPRFLSQMVQQAQEMQAGTSASYQNCRPLPASTTSWLTNATITTCPQALICSHIFKCSLLPGVELNACVSIDMTSPRSPCTVSNALTVLAT